MKPKIRAIILFIISLTFLSACQSQPENQQPPPPGSVDHLEAVNSTPQTNQNVRLSDSKPPPSVHFGHLSVEDGLAHSEVWAIAQDHQGFLWFGTQNGLSKFDGYSFTTYRHDPDDENSLCDNYVTSLFVDSGGVLWVGTFEGVLERFDRTEDTFTHFHHSNIPERIYDIAEDNAGNLWLGTARPGLLRFNPVTGEAETVWVASNVRGVDIDGDGNIWAASSESGIARVDPTTGDRDRYQPDYMIWDLASGPDGRIWLATIAAGVGVLDPDGGEFRYNLVNPDVLQIEGSNSIRKIYVDSEGLLWIGHFQTSLLRYDPTKDEFTHFVPDLTDPTSVMGNSVFSLYRDRAGILWVGYGIGGGINKLIGGSERFGHYRHIPDDPNSLNTNLVIAIAGQGDTLWFGTFSGLDRWNRSTGEWKNYQTNPTIPFSLVYSTVRSVYVDSQGTLWAGTEEGLERYDPAIDGFVYLGGPVVMWMHEGPSGRFWMATVDGLYELDRDHERFKTIQGGHGLMIMVHEDRSGIVWVGTSGDGLYRYDPATGNWRHYKSDPSDPTSLSHDTVEAILEDSNGVIWAATDGGLNRLDEGSRRFTRFTVANGLANDRIMGLLEDDFGDLWLATDSGLSRFHPDSGTFENYTTRDGVQGPNFWRNSYFKNEEGELFFGGANGINAFFPENIVPNPLVPPVSITRVSLFNEPLRTDLPSGEQMTFDHDQNYLSFDFVALDFTDPEQNQYAYQMVGLDSDWVQAGNRRHADYPNLRPGNYTFRVIGSNNDGIWNEVGASLAITIRPPFWKTSWFVSLVIAALIGAGYGAYRYRVRSLRERSLQLEKEVAKQTTELHSANLQLKQEMAERQRVEQVLAEKAAEAAVVEERNRLARELHDAVTQTLFSVSLLAEALPTSWENDPEEGHQLLREIRQLSRGALAEMRTLLHELRPTTIVETALSELLRQLAESVTGREGIPVGLQINCQCDLPDDLHVALYRIAQESLNNVVKHARATEVSIKLDCTKCAAEEDATSVAGKISLTVEDDGRGFDLGECMAEGMGLGIMQERAASVGATLRISSQPGDGTKIEVVWEDGER